MIEKGESKVTDDHPLDVSPASLLADNYSSDVEEILVKQVITNLLRAQLELQGFPG